MNETILITGATGLVGGNLAARLLDTNPPSHLYLLVRGKSREEAQHRLFATLRAFLPHLQLSTLERRTTILCGDITKERLGLTSTEWSDALDRVTHIVHSAANVQFDTSLEEALAVNYLGTKNVLHFAQHAYQFGRLQRVAYISTAYTCGNRGGVIREDELDEGQQFSNSYERSKFESERYVRRLMHRLPITVFRPSIIVGDSATGRTTAFNVLYVPLRLLHRGLLTILPGSRSVRLDVVPVDYVCDAIRHIFVETNDGIGATYHLTAGAGGATTLGEVVDLAGDFFKTSDRQTKIPKVRFVAPPIIRLLLRFFRGSACRAVGLMKIFESYMTINRVFDDTNTRASLRGTAIRPPRFSSYYQTILEYSVATAWGKRGVPANAA